MTDSDDSERARADRAVILARRRFFVASAVAGIATAQCDNPFRPCLEVAPPPAVDAGAPPTTATGAEPVETAPKPCLEYAPPREDAGLPQAPAEASAQPKPQPKPKPEPRPCLKIAIPDEQLKKSK